MALDSCCGAAEGGWHKQDCPRLLAFQTSYATDAPVVFGKAGLNRMTDATKPTVITESVVEQARGAAFDVRSHPVYSGRTGAYLGTLGDRLTEGAENRFHRAGVERISL